MWGKEAAEGTLMRLRYKENMGWWPNKMTNVVLSQKFETSVYMYWSSEDSAIK